MRKNPVSGLAVAGCIAAVSLAMPAVVHAADGSVPSYVELPSAGSYTIGEETPATNRDGHAEMGTEFYLRIENPAGAKDSAQGGNHTSKGVYYQGQLIGGASGYSKGSTPSGISAGPQPGSLPTLPEESYPKTGDYGPSKTFLLTTALFTGAAYLLCDSYEKKYRAMGSKV
jgi:hypothetical protein